MKCQTLFYGKQVAQSNDLSPKPNVQELSGSATFLKLMALMKPKGLVLVNYVQLYQTWPIKQVLKQEDHGGP